MENNTLIKQYIGIVQKIARVEHRRIPNHMIEYEELVSIGIIAIQTLIKGKTEEQLAHYNEAYIGTAVKWAIRNELRHRYKWYTMKHKKEDGDADSYVSDAVAENSDDNSDDMGFSISPTKVREAVYETILLMVWQLQQLITLHHLILLRIRLHYLMSKQKLLR